MSQLLLIRHGQARFGTDDYDRLSAIGQRQARLVGAQLADHGLSFDAWISGRPRRQQHTARLAAERLGASGEPYVDPGFDEYDADALFGAYLPGVLDEHPDLAARRDELHTDRRLFQRAFEQVMRRWLAGHTGEGDFEPWAAFKARVSAALARLHDDYPRDTRFAVFSSGGPIAVAVGTALGIPDTTTLELNWSLYNAAVTDLRSTRDGWRLLGFNDISAQRRAGDAALVTFR
ncbi:histidine phosphatase family protein [Salinisphaera sp. T31B1]|uniref:histidine phosphatase family protein n=1 Tax=Salinisphaera sp. T31B1 TaxID=727963 RepID=UPI00333F2BF1